MGFIASNGTSGAGTGAASAVYTFTSAVETIGEGDVVTLDTSSGTIQRANDYNIDLFGSNLPLAAPAVAVSTWNNAGAALIHTNTDGSLLYVEGSNHAGLGIAGVINQLMKVSADGSSVLNTIKLPSTTGNPTLVPLSGNRIALIQYASASAITVTTFDSNTLEQLSTVTTAFTGATSPFNQAGDAVETSGGQIVLYWMNTNVKYYAVLNPDFSVKTQPVNNGSVSTSSMTVKQRLRLSTGGVLIGCSYSATMSDIVSFDASGNYRNTYVFAAGSGQFDSSRPLTSANIVDQLATRSVRLVSEVGVDRVAFIMLKNQNAYSFCILNIATNTLVVEIPLGNANTSPTWCIKGNYAYVLAFLNENGVSLRYAVVNLLTSTVVTPLTALVVPINTSFSLTLQTGFIDGNDWWVMGMQGTYGTSGPIFWMVFTIDAGKISVRIPLTLSTAQGPIQDLTVFGGEVLFLAGGVTLNSNDVSLTYGRIDLKFGAYRAGAVIRTHTANTYPELRGIQYFPETKLLFRHGIEKAMAFGYGVGVPTNTLQRCYFKPNTSIVLGVAVEESENSDVSAALSGWVNVSLAYRRFQKTIDHASVNGNKVKNYGAAAYLTGSF